MQFVPPGKQGEKVPCRHIPLRAAGESLMDLYWGGTQNELEDALADWLRAKIAQIETAPSRTENGKQSISKEIISAPLLH